jgi:hypothetical protein
MDDLRHSLHATLVTTRSRQEIARLFAEQGLSARKCGWDEYEVRRADADLVIEADDPILLHGAVADARRDAAAIAAILCAAEILFAIETYDEGGTMILSLP